MFSMKTANSPDCPHTDPVTGFRATMKRFVSEQNLPLNCIVPEELSNRKQFVAKDCPAFVLWSSSDRGQRLGIEEPKEPLKNKTLEGEKFITLNSAGMALGS